MLGALASFKPLITRTIAKIAWDLLRLSNVMTVLLGRIGSGAEMTHRKAESRRPVIQIERSIKLHY